MGVDELLRVSQRKLANHKTTTAGGETTNHNQCEEVEIPKPDGGVKTTRKPTARR